MHDEIILNVWKLQKIEENMRKRDDDDEFKCVTEIIRLAHATC